MNTTLPVRDVSSIEDVVLAHKLRFTVPVTQPLVLISQIQRSGGTLIAQLLDGHSELHVHPGELHIGRPKKYDWPDLDLRQSPDALFERLFEKLVLEYAQFGYQKLSTAEALVDPDYRQRVLPFIFSAHVQRQLFHHLLQEQPIARQRDALDRYVTSYFNAWLDYQGLYRPPGQVKYWVAFGARLLTMPGNMDRFVADYPDGRTIAVVRDPVSWFASARRHSDWYANPEKAIALWLDSYGVIRDNVHRYPDSTLLVGFEECVADTGAVMARVAAYLGIRVEPCLLEPTFNGMAIESDSSFGAKRGIDRSAIDRRTFIESATQDAIRTATSTLYAHLTHVADEHARRYRSPFDERADRA